MFNLLFDTARPPNDAAIRTRINFYVLLQLLKDAKRQDAVAAANTATDFLFNRFD